jgi:hypothetical protein
MDETRPRVVALDLSGVSDLEYTALKMLRKRRNESASTRSSVWLIGLNPDVLEVVQRSPLGKALGTERMHFSLEVAVARFLEASGRRRRGDTRFRHHRCRARNPVVRGTGISPLGHRRDARRHDEPPGPSHRPGQGPGIESRQRSRRGEAINHELDSLSWRARHISRAITLCTITALLVCGVIATLFLGAFFGFDASGPAALLFVTAMLAFMAGLLLFVREVCARRPISALGDIRLASRAIAQLAEIATIAPTMQCQTATPT